MWSIARTAARLAGALAGTALLTVAATAQEPCGLCNTHVVTNSTLAACFLGEYDALKSREGAVIVVDLSGCAEEDSRSIAEALPGPLDTATGQAPEPDRDFMVSRAQLDCLKRKLEEPGLVLDPSTTIELSTCG